MKEATLKKYFTDEEIQFIQNLARQKGIKETDVIFSLAREMIQTYQLRYVSGQQVLAMLDLLAMKLPQWYALQLNLVGQSSMQITSLSRQLASLTQPSIWDRIVDLLRSPEMTKLLGNLGPVLTAFLPGFMKSGENKEQDNENEDDWL